MSAYWSIVSYAAGDEPLVLVDGPPYEPWVLVGKSLGDPAWKHDTAAPRGTRGRRPAPGELDNRQVAFTFTGSGADKDEMAGLLSQLAAAVDRCRRFGGQITFREHGQSVRQHFEVLVGEVAIAEWGTQEIELRDTIRPAVVATVEPYVYGDPMDWSDDFQTDLLATEYAVQAGAASNLTVASGLVSGAVNLSTENRVVLTGPAYQMGDHQASIDLSPGATLSGLKGGVLLKWYEQSGDETFLEVYLDDTGSASRLRIDKVVAGARSNLATTNLSTRMSAGTRSWRVVGRVEGNVVYAEVYAPGSDPYDFAPTHELDHVLNAGEIPVFGVDVVGLSGWSFTPQHSGATLSNFALEPFTYRGVTRQTIMPAGEIPGDAPAIADARITVPGSATACPFGLLAWSNRPEAFSFLGNWSFEKATTQWSVAAVSGVVGAGTSVSRITDDSRYGSACGSVVASSANSGVHYRINRRFRRGVTYTASCWVRSVAQTTAARVRLGVSGDISSSTATALSQTWTLRTITWTPTEDRDFAYFVFEITAAASTTFRIDGALVYEGTTEPVLPEKRGSGGPPWGFIDAADSNNTPTDHADAEGGFFVGSEVQDSGGGITILVPVRSDLLPADDYAGESTEVEVWARVLSSNQFTGGVTATVSTYGGGYTHEWGSAGVALVNPSETSGFVICRLGTVSLGRFRDRENPTEISVAFSIAAGANLQWFGVDWILLVNPAARCATLTGTDEDGTYPLFWTGGIRHVNSDLSGAMETDIALWPAGSMSGAMIELPTGPFEFVALASSEVPDSPTPHPAETADPLTVHLAVRPRWHWLRDA